MGKLARFACIFAPMLCTLASLVAVILLLISGTSKNMLPAIYHIRLDVRHINLQSSIDTVPGAVDVKVNTGITAANAKELGMDDFYTSHMWNYCSGSVSDNKWTINECKQPMSGYTFDVEKIVDEEAKKQITFPDSVKKVQKAINVVQKFMSACYVLGAVATAATFFVGWFGLLSRWGSCITTIIADVAFLFILTGSICSAVLAYSLKGAFNKAFDSFGVDCTVGPNWQNATWVATAFSFAASLFWMMSTCCCSGRTSKVMGHRGEPKHGKGAMKGERTPYTYERVASPYIGQSSSSNSVPMKPYGAAHSKPGYEPMRHGHV